jgi:uncharacterized protein with GYD domain
LIGLYVLSQPDDKRTRPEYNVGALVEKVGSQVHELLWTVGEYDIVCVVDFPDDESLTASLLRVGALGNIGTTTMRVFNAEQMTGVLDDTS